MDGSRANAVRDLWHGGLCRHGAHGCRCQCHSSMLWDREKQQQILPQDSRLLEIPLPEIKEELTSQFSEHGWSSLSSWTSPSMLRNLPKFSPPEGSVPLVARWRSSPLGTTVRSIFRFVHSGPLSLMDSRWSLISPLFAQLLIRQWMSLALSLDQLWRVSLMNNHCRGTLTAPSPRLTKLWKLFRLGDHQTGRFVDCAEPTPQAWEFSSRCSS